MTKLLSRNEVEAEWGISRRFLEIAAVRGDGPRMVRVGRLIKYRPEDIEAWVEVRTVSSTSENPGTQVGEAA